MATEAENSANNNGIRPERVRITYKRKLSDLPFYLQERCDTDSLLFECKPRLPSSLSWCSLIGFLQISIALDMAKDNNDKDRELIKRIEADPYMLCVVRECYASFKSIIKFMIQGPNEINVVEKIFAQIETHIQQGDLVREYKMSALPSLYETFVKLMKFLLENKLDDRYEVDIYFQDVLEVVARHITEDTSVLESLHGGSLHERMATFEEHSQLLASEGATKFPIEPLTEA